MFIQQAAEIIAPYVGLTKEETERLLEIPPDPALGDVALPCFTMARSLRRSPNDIAASLAATIEDERIRCTAAGPYVNLSFQREETAAQWLRELSDSLFCTPNIGGGERVAIDMSSPNIAKPFGIGHLRSTVIGNALYHILTAVGYDAIRINHLGDWGTQFGKLIAAYRRWGDEDALKREPIAESLKLYVRFHEEAENDPSLTDEGRAWFAKLENGDPEALKLWHFFVEESKKEFQRIYERLGVSFEYELGESFYNDKMSAVIESLQSLGILEESEGALVVRLVEESLPPCLIVKSDGSSIYATRDLATAIYRKETLGSDLLLYVVGAEQALHFRQIFAVLRRMGYSWSGACEHVPFGLMRFEGKKMSTRKGRVVFLEEVLNEAVKRALEIVSEKNPGLQDREAVAEAIGVGAVVFGDLKNDRQGAVDFSIDDAVRFEGETGPYLQYTNARIQSLLAKSGDSSGDGTDPDMKAICGDSAWSLLKELMVYPGVLKRAAKQREPSLLAKQLLEIAKAFNRFYHAERVLFGSASEQAAKLRLCERTGYVLQQGLKLLGIKAPSRI